VSSRSGDQLADAFIEQTVRRSAALPWLMDDEHRRRFQPSRARVTAAAVLAVVMVVSVLVAAAWPTAPGAVSGAERSACALAVADAPVTGPGGRLVVSPALVDALARSANRVMMVESRPLGEAADLRPAAIRGDYLDVLDVCRTLGLDHPG
jgi:hypothetical protein